MWTQLPYLLQAQISLALMWLFYRIVFQRDTRLARSRFFLLAGFPVSLLLPLLAIPVLPGAETVLPVSLMMLPAVMAETVGTTEPVAAGFGFEFYILFVSAAGSVVLGFVTALNTLPWLRLMRGSVCRVPAYGRLKVVYTPAVETACTLFGCVFVNRDCLKDENDFYPVLAHEMAHVRLRHSWDLVLVGTFRILFWWNPFVWLWYRSLREVHEYQADRYVLQEDYPAERYIGLMTRQFSDSAPAFASGFSYSLVKRRIMMIAAGKPSRWAHFKVLLVIPLLGVLTTLFSFTEQTVVPTFQETDIISITEPNAAPTGTVVMTETPDPPVSTPAEIAVGVAETVLPGASDLETLIDTLRLRENMQQLHETIARTRKDSARIPEIQRQAVATAEEGRQAAKALVLIDGIEQHDTNALSQLDPKDIESITVLKDTVATTLYGSCGRNGVILVTTKSNDSNRKITIP